MKLTEEIKKRIRTAEEDFELIYGLTGTITEFLSFIQNKENIALLKYDSTELKSSCFNIIEDQKDIDDLIEEFIIYNIGGYLNDRLKEFNNGTNS